MKRIISFAAALTLVFGAASCQKESQASDADVVFSVELPSDVVTKANDLPDMGDGSTVDELIYRIYAAGEVKYSGVIPRVGTSNKFTLSIKLVKGMEYDLLFWAQKSATGYYNTDNLKEVVANYDGLSNDETRDAYYGSYPKFVAGTTPNTVYLKRPFAQVNFGSAADDWSSVQPFVAVTDDEGNPQIELKSSMTLKGVPYKFNVAAGDVVAGSVKDINFGLSYSPIAEAAYDNDYISHDSKDYAWVAMNYILAPKAGTNVAVEAGFVHSKNAAAPLVKAVPEAPVKQNYRTNILGDVFTESNSFEIVIVPGFDGDEIVPLK